MQTFSKKQCGIYPAFAWTSFKAIYSELASHIHCRYLNPSHHKHVDKNLLCKTEDLSFKNSSDLILQNNLQMCYKIVTIVKPFGIHNWYKIYVNLTNCVPLQHHGHLHTWDVWAKLKVDHVATLRYRVLNNLSQCLQKTGHAHLGRPGCCFTKVQKLLSQS